MSTSTGCNCPAHCFCDAGASDAVLANPLRKTTVSSVSFTDEILCADDADGLYYADGWSVPTEDLPSSSDPSSSGTSALAVPQRFQKRRSTQLSWPVRAAVRTSIALPRLDFRQARRTTLLVGAGWHPGLIPALPQPQAGVTADAGA